MPLHRLNSQCPCVCSVKWSVWSFFSWCQKKQMTSLAFGHTWTFCVTKNGQSYSCRVLLFSKDSNYISVPFYWHITNTQSQVVNMIAYTVRSLKKLNMNWKWIVAITLTLVLGTVLWRHGKETSDTVRTFPNLSSSSLSLLIRMAVGYVTHADPVCWWLSVQQSNKKNPLTDSQKILCFGQNSHNNFAVNKQN